MKTLSKLFFVLTVLILSIVSCSKDDENTVGDSDNPTKTDLPANADETFNLITKKWDFDDSQELNSIELTKDTMYIVDVSQQLKSTTGSSEIITGKFEISADGKIITLTGYGTMTLTQVSDSSITITIVLEDGKDLGNITGEKQEVVSYSEKTILLSKTWTMLDTETDGYVICNGDTINNTVDWIFTTSGQLIVHSFSFDETSDGECFYSEQNQGCVWEFTDNENNLLIDNEINFEIILLSDNELTLKTTDDEIVNFKAKN